jgi:hypothetical protein
MEPVSEAITRYIQTTYCYTYLRPGMRPRLTEDGQWGWEPLFTLHSPAHYVIDWDFCINNCIVKCHGIYGKVENATFRMMIVSGFRRTSPRPDEDARMRTNITDYIFLHFDLNAPTFMEQLDEFMKSLAEMRHLDDVHSWLEKAKPEWGVVFKTHDELK